MNAIILKCLRLPTSLLTRQRGLLYNGIIRSSVPVVARQPNSVLARGLQVLYYHSCTRVWQCIHNCEVIGRIFLSFNGVVVYLIIFAISWSIPS